MKRDTIFRKLFLQLLAINILTGLIQPFNQFVDNALTGMGLGTDALKAYALFLPLGALAFALSFVFSIGTQISCSHRIGKGKIEEGRNLFATSLLITLIFSAVFSFALFIFSDNIALLLGRGSEEVVNTAGTASFIRGYSIGLVPMFLLSVMLILMQIEGKKIFVTVSSLSIFVINLSSDLLNLYVFKAGLFGMALATSISYIVVFIFVLYYFLFKSKMFRLTSCKLSTVGLRDVVKNGIPSLTYYGSLVIRSYVFNWLIITRLDGDTLAIMTVVNSFVTLVDAFIGGTGDVTLLLGGVVYGERDKNAAKRLLRIAVISGTSILLLITLATIIFANPIAMIFLEKGTETLVSGATRALCITSLCFVPDVIACVLKKYIQSVGRSLYTSVSNILCNVVYVCGFAIILVDRMGTDGLFLSFLACYVLGLVTHIIYAFIVSAKEGTPKCDMFLYLPKDYTGDHEHVYEVPVNNMDEATAAFMAVGEFCRKCNLSQRICYHISLFVEEITCNIIDYGFNKNGRNTIFIRVVVTETRVALFVKDNCMYFDPKHYYESLTEKSDVTKDIGIRIVMTLADKVTYTNRFNMNHLMIEIPV